MVYGDPYKHSRSGFCPLAKLRPLIGGEQKELLHPLSLYPVALSPVHSKGKIERGGNTGNVNHIHLEILPACYVVEVPAMPAEGELAVSPALAATGTITSGVLS